MTHSHRILFTLLLLVSVLARLVSIWFFGDVDFEPDSYTHFIYSESAFARLPGSLNYAAGVWAKPLFTLLCGAIIWITGVRMLWIVKILNTLVWSVVSLLTYRLARGLGLSHRAGLISVFLTAFSYLGFRASIGTLTEPLFALLVLAAIVLLYARRYRVSCALISASALVRSEGLLLLLGWVVILWGLHRRRRLGDLVVMGALPFLWNLWGYVLNGDPTYILTSGYPIASAPYGHGGWLHYPTALLRYEPVIWPLSLLGVVLTARRPRYYSLHLLLGFFVGFNVVAWRFGLFGTAGILRYFVPIIPWLAIYAALVFDRLKLALVFRHWAMYALNPLVWQVAFTLLVLNSRTGGYGLYNTPTVHPALMEAGQWIRMNHANDFVYASHPALLYYAGRDMLSGKMEWNPARIRGDGIIAFDRDFGSARLRRYAERSPLLAQFRDYLWVYDHRLSSVAVRQTIPFNTEDIQPYLRDGWSRAEDWGMWAVGSHSEVVLHASVPHTMTIAVLGFPQTLHGRQQSVEARYNSVSLGIYEFPKEIHDPQWFSFRVPKSLVSGQLDVLRFDYGYAISPQELGMSSDSRQLAVGFVEISIAVTE